MAIERMKNSRLVRGTKECLRKLDEEHLAFKRETPEGTQTITFRQFIGLPLLKPWGPILDRLPVDEPSKEGSSVQNSNDT